MPLDMTVVLFSLMEVKNVERFAPVSKRELTDKGFEMRVRSMAIPYGGTLDSETRFDPW